MIDIRRRFFLFGATAALVVPVKTIFVMPKPVIIIDRDIDSLYWNLLEHPNCRCSLEALVPNVPTGEDLARWAGLI